MITTIITTHNRALLLKRAINSVLNQTFSDFQICIYDNASDDETETIVKNFTQKDSRIKYHRHEKNIGMMQNYQFAFDRINTPYFHLLSDDDYLLPCFFETALDGLKKFPEAAISACGILQINENGDFVANPLAKWKKEGLYAPQEGMLQMITAHRYPVPTGVLFQTKFAQNIKPELSSEIQIFWDPDYLIQIAARYPIVINKHHCGIYLVHANSFAFSIYSNIPDQPSNIEVFLKATSKVMKNIKNNAYLSEKNRSKALRAFKKNIFKDTMTFRQLLLKKKKYRSTLETSNAFYRHVGLSFTLLFSNFFILLFRSLVAVIRLIKKLRMPAKRNLNSENNISNSLSREELEQHNLYGKKLFNDLY